MRARLYHPELGHFISQDTYAYNWQNPVEANRYGYAANNPATLWDPSGYTALLGYSSLNTNSENEGHTLSNFYRQTFVDGGWGGAVGYVTAAAIITLVEYILISVRFPHVSSSKELSALTHKLLWDKNYSDLEFGMSIFAGALFGFATTPHRYFPEKEILLDPVVDKLGTELDKLMNIVIQTSLQNGFVAIKETITRISIFLAGVGVVEFGTLFSTEGGWKSRRQEYTGELAEGLIIYGTGVMISKGADLMGGGAGTSHRSFVSQLSSKTLSYSSNSLLQFIDGYV